MAGGAGPKMISFHIWEIAIPPLFGKKKIKLFDTYIPFFFVLYILVVKNRLPQLFHKSVRNFESGPKVGQQYLLYFNKEYYSGAHTSAVGGPNNSNKGVLTLDCAAIPPITIVVCNNTGICTGKVLYYSMAQCGSGLHIFSPG